MPLPRVGFTILSHGNPGQLKRLVKALDREFDCPTIACHHDFGQAALDPLEFGPNVNFVRPHISTGWGRYSVVKAQLAALELLYSNECPSWFFNLSAADYPIMQGSKVRNQLDKIDFDAFLDARSIRNEEPKATIFGPSNSKLYHFDSTENRKLKAKFYRAREFWIPLIRRDPHWRLGRFTFRFGAVRGLLPIFYGDHWFGGNAKVAQTLLNPTPEHRAFQRHLAYRTQADETYYHTVLMNEPDLTICLDNKRFAEWNGGGAHPMLLTETQVREALSSGAFFARKFEHGAAALDLIDQALE